MLKTLSDGILFFLAHQAITLSLAVFFLLPLGVVFAPLRKREKTRLALFLLLFFSLSILLRLAYLSDILVPPYFDSVTHLRIINALLDGFQQGDLPPLSGLTAAYYHLGFHWLVSLLTLGLRADPINVMLILGQITLAALPIPLFLFIYQHTASKSAALLTALLAGFGWYQPSLLIDWGKYPALTGLFFFEISLLYAGGFPRSKDWKSLLCAEITAEAITTRGKTKGKKEAGRGRFLVLLLLLFLTIFFHTRMLIVIGVSLFSWLFALKTAAFPPRYQNKILSIQLLLFLIFGFLLYQDPLLVLTLEPYFLKPGLYSTALILLFSLFARKRYTSLFYFNLFFILGLFAALLLPLPDWGSVQRLLDRPFVEMLLHLPLSLLAGITFAALRDRMITALKTRWLRRAAASFSLGLLILLGIFMLQNHRFSPSDCCTLVEEADIIIFDWINHNLSERARIAAAGNPLEVMPDTNSPDLVGSDAGIWLPYFTGREILLFPYTADFSRPAIRQQLCQSHVDYIYVGANTQSFNDETLLGNEHWYKEIVSFPQAQLFALEDCPISLE